MRRGAVVVVFVLLAAGCASGGGRTAGAAPTSITAASSSTVAPTTTIPSTTTTTTTVPPTAPASFGTWRPLTPFPLRPRAAPVSAWTGREWLVWGGIVASVNDACGGLPDVDNECEGHPLADGAAFDPSTGRWRVLPPVPVHLWSDDLHVGGWTGHELVIWGGRPAETFAYDPTADAWRTLPAGPLQPLHRARAVWTGTELIIGFGAGSTEGAALDPKTGTWRRIAAAPSPGTGSLEQPVWTGREVLAAPDGSPVAYEPTADRWSVLTGSPELFAVTSAWTGDRWLRCGRVFRATATGEHSRQVAEAYVPARGRWIPSAACPMGEVHGPMIGTATGAIVVNGGGVLPGGQTADSVPPRGEPEVVRYDQVHDRWDRLPPSGLKAAYGRTGIWTGTEVLVLGADDPSGARLRLAR